MLSEEHAGDRLPRKMRHAESRVGVRAGPNGIMAGDDMAGDDMAGDDMEGESGWIP